MDAADAVDGQDASQDDAYNDARDDRHVRADEAVPADVLHQAAMVGAAAERGDAVVAGRMHRCLLTGKSMRECISS